MPHLNGLRTPAKPVNDPEQGNWYPASGGAEQPFTTRTGKRLQYVWQPSTGRHAYLDLSTDLILTDAEAEQALALY